MKTTSSLCSLLLIANTLPAQASRSALPIIPDGSVLVLQMDRPAKLKESFATTNISDLLSSAPFQDAIEPALRALEERLSELSQLAGSNYEDSRDAILGYGGRVTLAVGADFEALGKARDRSESMQTGAWAVLVLAPDNRTDLASIVKQCGESAEEELGEDSFRDLEQDGKTHRVHLSADPDEPTITLPFMLGQHAVMVAGRPIEAALRRVHAEKKDDSSELEKALESQSLALHLDIEQPMGMLGKLVGLSQGPGTDSFVPIVLSAFDLLGMKAMQNVGGGVRASGRYVVVDFTIKMESEGRGIFDAMYTTRKGPVNLLELVPYHRNNWSVAPIKLRTLYSAIGRFVDNVGQNAGKSMKDFEAMIEQKCKIRLEEDLIAHLGDEMMSVSADTLEKEPDPDAIVTSGDCFGVSLADSAAFAASLEKVIRGFALHPSRKTEDYGTYKISQIKLLGLMPLAYCVTDRVFLVATGESGLRELRAVLDEETERRANKTKPEMQRAVQKRLELAPAGWQGITVMSILTLIDEVLHAVEGEIGEELEGVTDAMALARSLIEEYRMDTMVAVSKAGESRILNRVIW